MASSYVDGIESSNDASTRRSSMSIMSSRRTRSTTTDETTELPADNKIYWQFKKDGFTSKDVKLLGMQLQIPFAEIDEAMDKDREDVAMQGVHVLNTWKKQSSKKECNRDTFLNALKEIGKIRTSRALSTEYQIRRRSSTIHELKQKNVWPMVEDFNKEQAKVFIQNLVGLVQRQSIDEEFNEELGKQYNHPGLVAFVFFGRWKDNLTSSGSSEVGILYAAHAEALGLSTTPSGTCAENNFWPPVDIGNSKQQQPGQTQDQQQQQQRGDQPRDEQSMGEQSRDDQLREEQLRDNQPKNEQLRGEQLRGKQLRDEQPKDDQPRDEQLRDEQPRGEQLRNEQTRDEQPRDEQPKDEHPRDEQPRDEQRRDKQLRDEQPRSEQPRGQPRDDQPRDDQPRDDHQPRDNQPRNEQPRDEQSRNEQLRNDSDALNRGHSVLALSGIMLIAIILAIVSIGLISCIIRMVDPPIYPEKSKIYPIFRGDTISIPIRSAPPYIDVELIGGFIDIGGATNCRASIIATDHVKYSNASTLINPPLDNVYLAEGSSVLINSNDVLISGILEVWLFSSYEKLNAALENSFGNVIGSEIDHDCSNPSEDVLCETISPISRDLKFSIDKPSYYSMRCVPDKQFNCSSLRNWTYNKVDYSFDNESAIYYNITNRGMKRIDLIKSPTVLAQLSDECDNFYFIIVHYPSQHHITKLYLALAFIGLPVIILSTIAVVVIYLWCKFRACNRAQIK